MDEATFWELVEQSRQESGGDEEKQTEVMYELLMALPTDDIVDFDDMMYLLKKKAYLVRLWDVAVLIIGGCSDDGFIDFRSWLIAQGKEVFYNALDNPDTLALVVDKDTYPDFFYFGYIGASVYRDKTAQDEVPTKIFIDSNPQLDKPFAESEEYPTLFPLLWEKFKDQWAD